MEAPLSSSSSSSSAASWVQRISSIFRTEIDIHHLPRVCVFEVPGTIRAQKPEAYSPQLIAMGPYHHLRPELYQMERYKLAAIKQISTPHQIFNFQTLVIDKFKDIDPLVRACYNKLMDYDKDTLAWILAIDACFFLHLVDAKVMLDNTIITSDFFMLENQIPFLLLKEMRQALSAPESDGHLISLMVPLCESHSPVLLSAALLNSDRFRMPLHLLDLLYHMIVNVPPYLSEPLDGQLLQVDVPRYDQFKRNTPQKSVRNPDFVHNNLDAIIDVVETLGNERTKVFIRPVKVVSTIPWSTLSGLFRKGNSRSEDENPDDAIPSASQLYRYSRVKCRPFTGSIDQIKFVEDEAALYLPILSLNASSEVIIRNLVAYEAAMSRSTLEFAHYINLMSGIVATAPDVKMLRQDGVIMGSMKDEEIAEMFNGMERKYVRSDSYSKSNIDAAIQKLNKYYGNKLMVRLARHLKRNLNASWRCLALFSTIALLILVAMQTFCEFFECSKVFHF